MDGQADAANKRITDALSTLEAEQDRGDESEAESEQPRSCGHVAARTELVPEALEMSVVHRNPDPGLIHHSDRGT
jgi:hypothetical protein